LKPEVPIANVPDGEQVTIAGRVESTLRLLTSPMSQSACVVYEVHDDDGNVRERDAVDFLVRDDSGHARIVANGLETALLGHARRQRIALIDANIHEVSAKLSELKDRARRASGPNSKALHAEMRSYKRVATLLCAAKAATRGRVHGGMTKREQTDLIEREASALGDARAGRFAVDVQRLEALLLVGQEVRVTGLGRWQADASGGGGYRQAGKVLVIAGTSSNPARLELAARERQRALAGGARASGRKPTPSVAPPSPSTAPPPSLSPMVALAVVLALLAGIYGLL
jgi:hypothetical protein